MKWFEACSVKSDKGFAREKDAKGHSFDPFPGKQAVRKILKEKYYQTVDALAIKQLIVNMCEELTQMGFGFKICQIKGEEDKLFAIS